MKATISFSLPEEAEELNLALKAGKMQAALQEVKDRVFRPARKHGYSDVRMKQFCDENGELKDNVVDVIGVLEEMYFEIINDFDLNS